MKDVTSEYTPEELEDILYKSYVKYINTVTIELDKRYFPRPTISYTLENFEGKRTNDISILATLGSPCIKLLLDAGTIQGNNEPEYTHEATIELRHGWLETKVAIWDFFSKYILDLDTTLVDNHFVPFTEVKIDEDKMEQLFDKPDLGANLFLSKLLNDYAKKCGILAVFNYYHNSEDVLMVLESGK